MYSVLCSETFMEIILILIVNDSDGAMGRKEASSCQVWVSSVMDKGVSNKHSNDGGVGDKPFNHSASVQDKAVEAILWRAAVKTRTTIREKAILPLYRRRVIDIGSIGCTRFIFSTDALTPSTESWRDASKYS